MGYDLAPRNKELKSFHFGAFSFPVLLEQIGWLFSCAQDAKTGMWMCCFGEDPRMGDNYPMLLTNDGFPVTAFEAKVMARCARNYSAYQRALPEGAEKKIRSDFVDKFEAFADWAEKSRGFKIR